MATPFLHAAVPLVLRRIFRRPVPHAKRLAIVAVLCSCLPDLDLVTYAFELRTTDVLGHRGLSHSLFVAAVIAIVATGIGFRSAGWKTRGFWRIFAFLFVVTASHGLLDAMTNDEAGVALLAPFSSHRYFFPIRVLPSCQLGTASILSFWGLLTIANEIFYVVVPLALFVSIVAPRGALSGRSSASSAALIKGVLWLGCILVLRRVAPEFFSPWVPRVIEAYGTLDAGKIEDVPRAGLPDEKLTVRFDALRSLGLFDVPLVASNPDWSSSFFPSWFGGESGRWTEPRPVLVWRTLTGFNPPTEREARSWVSAAEAGDAAARDRLFTLSPTEKVDLAFGHFDFPASVQGLSHSHNTPLPRFWSGRCNGVAGASLFTPEPFRVVDVISVDGAHIRFHPNDVKALLSVAYYELPHHFVGQSCNLVSFDPGARCSVNPAVFTIAVLNRIGLAHASFLVDALPSVAIQFYAVSAARAHVTREPYAPAGAPIEPSLVGRTAALVDVEIALTLSSSTLAYPRANVPDPSAPGGSRYERVGVVPVVMTYDATLALGPDSTILGGRWTGTPPNGPDSMNFVEGDPPVDGRGMLRAADRISWAFVRELARASASDEAAEPTLDLRTACDGKCP